MIKYRMLICWAIDKYTEVIMLAKDKAEAEKRVNEIVRLLASRRPNSSQKGDKKK